MKRILCVAIAVAVGLAGNAMATKINSSSPNLEIKFSGVNAQDSVGAGLYKYDFVAPTNINTYITEYGYAASSTWDNGNAFYSFCIEYPEHVTPGETYDATLDLLGTATPAYEGGGGASSGSPYDYDPISIGTAWLYYNFARGNAGFVLTTNQQKQDLQKAIWYLEDEANGVNNSFVTLAVTQFGSMAAAQADYDATFNDTNFQELIGGQLVTFKVYAVNLWEDVDWTTEPWDREGPMQSTLFMTNNAPGNITPEPATFLIWGLGICLFGLSQRRR